MTVMQVPVDTAAARAADTRAAQAIDLADEHAELLRQVAVRSEALLAAVAAGRWPAREAEALLGYLRAEILRQTAGEEALLFPARGGQAGFTGLARDHARLRTGIEALEHAVHDNAGATERLAVGTRDLLCQLERHLAAEEAVLGGPGDPGGAPATTALGAHPHEWYPLTEGPVIDLDALPPDQIADAAAERVLRLRPGEHAELRSGHDPNPVWRRVNQLAPGRYGFVYLEDGPARWRVLVTRREQG